MNTLTVVGILLIVILTRVADYQRKYPGVKQQLKIFKSLGFVLNEGVSDEDVYQMWGSETYKGYNPFTLLYIHLGSTMEKEPWTPITNQVWYFDTEAIEDSGSYVNILKNLERISQGEIKFSNVSDTIDFENEKASVCFDLNGESYKYDLEFDSDWADPRLFTNIVELTKKYETKRKFTYFGISQDLVIGYSSEEELMEINKKTQLGITWLG